VENDILQVLSGGADAATIVIALALVDLRQRMAKVEDKILYILTELAKRGTDHKFTERH
jgi:hypothetical protein